MSDNAIIQRPDWGDGERNAAVPAEGSAIDALQRDHPAADIADTRTLAPGTIVGEPAALEAAERIEAGMSASDVDAINGLVGSLSGSAQAKLRTALASPPLPGREDQWLDKFQKTLTLSEASEVMDAVWSLSPSQAQGILAGLADQH